MCGVTEILTTGKLVKLTKNSSENCLAVPTKTDYKSMHNLGFSNSIHRYIYVEHKCTFED